MPYPRHFCTALPCTQACSFPLNMLCVCCKAEVENSYAIADLRYIRPYTFKGWLGSLIECCSPVSDWAAHDRLGCWACMHVFIYPAPRTLRCLPCCCPARPYLDLLCLALPCLPALPFYYS